jgi:hypothetical protein
MFWEHLPTLIEQSLNSRKARPSGLTFSSKNRPRYVFGCRRWNVAALIASEGVEEAAIPQATTYIGGFESKPSRSRWQARGPETPVHPPDDSPTGATVAVSRLQAAGPQTQGSFCPAAARRLFRRPSEGTLRFWGVTHHSTTCARPHPPSSVHQRRQTSP